MSTITALFALLAIYQIKHFVADYPLQGKFMLGKFSKEWWVWIPALTAHAGVHALFTWNIAMWFPYFTGHRNFDPTLAIILACIDFVAHFWMDRIKASPSMLGRFKALTSTLFLFATPKEIRGNTYFWWCLGLDQMVHHLTHYYIIYALLIAYFA